MCFDEWTGEHFLKFCVAWFLSLMEGWTDQGIGLLCFILLKKYHGSISANLENFPRWTWRVVASAVNLKNVVSS